MSVDDDVYRQPVAVGSELITDPNIEVPYTARRECDARGALVRGLAEYLSQLSAPWTGGATLRLLRVVEQWAEPETLSVYPSAAVYSDEPGTYDAESLSTRRETLPDGRVIQTVAGLVQNLTVDVWCTSQAERTGLIALLEDALDPVEFMSGFHLRLPHYFNVIATYLKDSITVADSAENAGRRWRVASITVNAACPQLKLIGAVPGLDPRISAEVLDA